jgi:hypothetical protein
MKSDQYMQQVFGEFWECLKQNADIHRGKKLDHSNYVLPNRTRKLGCYEFISMATFYTSGLILEVNRFLLNIAHADSWFQVAQKHEKNERISLLWEYADPHLELSVGRPYLLRNHFIYAAVRMLSHSNMLILPDWKDDCPSDEDINYKCLDKYGTYWKHFKHFKVNISHLNNKEFIDATCGFRNQSQHRFRTHFDTGLTPFVERNKNNNRICYTSKMIPPLDLHSLFPELYKQHLIAAEVFQAYWVLVKELCAEWDKPNARI